MANTAKTLAQLQGTAALTTLYTVPGATSVISSSLCICNRGISSQVFRVSVAVAGAVDDPKQYLYYDLPIGPNDTFIMTIGITLAATDVVRVLGPSDLSFNLFGIEVT